MLLNNKFSSQHDLWNIFFEYTLKANESPIDIVDKLRVKVTDDCDEVYNLVLEKHTGLFRRDRPDEFLNLSG